MESPHQSAAPAPPAASPPAAPPRPSLAARGARVLGWVALTSLLAVVGSILGGHLLEQRVNRELHQHVRTLLKQHFDGFQVELASVRRVGERGIELADLRIWTHQRPVLQQRPAGPLLSADRVFVACRTDLPAFLASAPQITSVRVSGLTLHAVRHGDGSWNLESLLEHSGGHKPLRFPVIVQRAQLQVSDSRWPTEQQLRFDDISLTCNPRVYPPLGGNATTTAERLLTPAAARTPARDVAPPSRRPAESAVGTADSTTLPKSAAAHWEATGPPRRPQAGTRIEATLRGTHIDACRLTLDLLPATLTWRVRGVVERARISENWLRWLPSTLSPSGVLPRVQGECSGEFAAEGTRARLDDFRVAGGVRHGTLHDPRLPFPLHDVQFNFSGTPRGLRISDMAARGERADLQLVAERPGWSSTSGWQVQGKVTRFPLDDRVLEKLPVAMQQTASHYRPRGEVDAQFSFTQEDSRWIPVIHFQLRRGELTYDEFPLLLRHVAGSGTWTPARFHFDLQAPLSGRKLNIRGDLRPVPGDCLGWVEVRSSGPIPLSEALVKALPPAPQQVVRDFQPQGTLSVHASIVRERVEDEALRQLEIRLHDSTITHRKFPFPIRGIQGTLKMTNEDWVFTDLRGRNDGGRIACRGSWDHQRDGQNLLLTFVGQHIPLNEELKAAFPHELQHAWTRLNPRGSVDRVVVELTLDARTQELQVEVAGEKWAQRQPGAQGITLQPDWFPLRFDDVSGKFRWSDSILTLTEVRGRHGDAEVELDGKWQLRDGQWQCDLQRIVASEVVIDRELLAALPPALSKALRGVNLIGPVNLDGWMRLGGTQPGPGEIWSAWNLRVDVEEGAMHLGLPLTAIRGGAQIQGTSRGNWFQCQGDLAVDSLLVQGVPCVHLRGPLWIDSHQVLLGKAASSRRRDPGPPRPLTANTFGGLIAASVVLNATQDELPYALTAELFQGDLHQVALDARSGDRNIHGVVAARLDLKGSQRGLHTLKGGGTVQLSDADIYEVPVVVALLSLLRIRRPERTAFTTGEIAYRIEGDRIYFDRLDFHGEAITLKGSGEMNFARQIDLNFYALVGRDKRQVPNLFHEASRQLLLIEVAGSLADPQIERRAFPELNEKLHELFPELRRDQTARNLSIPRLWQR